MLRKAPGSATLIACAQDSQQPSAQSSLKSKPPYEPRAAFRYRERTTSVLAIMSFMILTPGKFLASAGIPAPIDTVYRFVAATAVLRKDCIRPVE